MRFIRNDVPDKADHRREAFVTERAIRVKPDRFVCRFAGQFEAPVSQIRLDQCSARFEGLAPEPKRGFAIVRGRFLDGFLLPLRSRVWRLPRPEGKEPELPPDIIPACLPIVARMGKYDEPVWRGMRYRDTKRTIDAAMARSRRVHGIARHFAAKACSPRSKNRAHGALPSIERTDGGKSRLPRAAMKSRGRAA